jgi:3-oxoacyl-[acyl-carrier protein] reductase
LLRKADREPAWRRFARPSEVGIRSADAISRRSTDAIIRNLVHAAGLLRVGRLGAMAPEDGATMWRLHVEAATRLADILVSRMGADGRVVLIGSRTAAGAAGRSAYAASKAALVGLARSWAAELMPRGITANVVAPAATETPMLTDPSRGRSPRSCRPSGGSSSSRRSRRRSPTSCRPKRRR